jgi:hypothetical protein
MLDGSLSFEELRKFLGAGKNKTTEMIGEERNPEFGRLLTGWLVIIHYCTHGQKALENTEFPSWALKVPELFDSFGRFHKPTELPRTLQRDWIDVFRL